VRLQDDPPTVFQQKAEHRADARAREEPLLNPGTKCVRAELLDDNRDLAYVLRAEDRALYRAAA